MFHVLAAVGELLKAFKTCPDLYLVCHVHTIVLIYICVPFRLLYRSPQTFCRDIVVIHGILGIASSSLWLQIRARLVIHCTECHSAWLI